MISAVLQENCSDNSVGAVLEQPNLEAERERELEMVSH